MKDLLKLIPLLNNLSSLLSVDPEAKEERYRLKTKLKKEPRWQRQFYKRAIKMLKKKKEYEKLLALIEEAEKKGEEND